MNEVFTVAKNGDSTCSLNGINLHSLYNPQKEAERFVASIEETVHHPSFVVVTGAALSYCAPFLRTKFPYAKLCAVQYSKSFAESNALWDYAITVQEAPSLCNVLYSIIGEECASSTLFLSWPPSELAYKTEYSETWREIKQFVSMARDILGTRIYFNKRWLKNTITFFSCVESVALPSFFGKSPFTPTEKSRPIVVAASGPSLQPLMPTLKELRKSFYLIAASSAITPLLQYGIIPDAAISTDGGFWAQSHLKQLTRLDSETAVPLFMASESSVSRTMLNSHTIIPLAYGDAIESLLFEYLKIPFVKAERNGTVSGTVAELALMLSDAPVYAVGLDLCTCNGFQHTQPNELEKTASLTDNRLSPLATRNAVSGFENGSLTVYRNWFSTRSESFYTRFFRVYHESFPYKNSLTNIKDITQPDFAAHLKKTARFTDSTGSEKNVSKDKNAAHRKNAFFYTVPISSKTERRKTIITYMESIKAKLSEYEKTALPVNRYDSESSLWLKTIDLGAFLNANRLKTPVSSDKMNGVIAFIDTLIKTVAHYE